MLYRPIYLGLVVKLKMVKARVVGKHFVYRQKAFTITMLFSMDRFCRELELNGL
jgi:hypothetical protein